MSWPIVISVGALLVSAANLYVTQFHRKRALYLAVVSHIGRDMTPGFAIINAGSEDIIIVTLSYALKKESRSFEPAQVCEWNESDSLLIAKGKGIHAKISFPERFTKSFVESGIPSTSSQGLFEHDLFLNVSWIQGDGERLSKSVHVAVVGLSPEGEIRMVSRRCEKTNLYEERA
jgi:hypothetical protein